MEKPEIKLKDGTNVEVVPIKGLKFKRGFGHILDKITLYANQKGDWFVEKNDILEYLKE